MIIQKGYTDGGIRLIGFLLLQNPLLYFNVLCFVLHTVQV